MKKNTRFEKIYKKKDVVKKNDTVKNLQANSGWTSGKVASTKYMDKSRINVSYKTKKP